MSDHFGDKYFPPGYFPGGYFQNGEANANAMVAALSGGASVTASLTATTVAVTGGGSKTKVRKKGRRAPTWTPRYYIPEPATPAFMSAAVAGASSCEASLSAVASIAAEVSGGSSLEVSGTTRRSYRRETEFWLMAA